MPPLLPPTRANVSWREGERAGCGHWLAFCAAGLMLWAVIIYAVVILAF
jgi:hypothetical protein